jgi:archaetidylinositol phosphate synthase
MLDKLLSETKLKKKFDIFFAKILKNRLSANQLTLLGLSFGVISAVLIFLSSVFTTSFLIILSSGIILMIISFFIDLLDGAIARYNETTVFGGILDMICDRTVEVSIIIAIILSDPINLVVPGIFLLGSIVLCITVFLSVGHAIKTDEYKENQKFIFYSSGLMERSETFLMLLIILILISFRYLLLWIFTILICFTALQRLKFAYQRLHRD